MTKPTIRLVRPMKNQISCTSVQTDQNLQLLHVPYTASGLSKEG